MNQKTATLNLTLIADSGYRSVEHGIRISSSTWDAIQCLLVIDAFSDVIAERLRQMNEEGFSTQRDDTYVCGELSKAAACYAAFTQEHPAGDPAEHWPWDKSWWKPSKDRRKNLVKAAALMLAEIERIDRAKTTDSVPL